MPNSPKATVFDTVILRTAAFFLLPLQLLFSIFLLLRGHDEPGGGFIAGLVASGGFVLYLFARGVESTRKVIRMDPRDLLGLGLLFGVFSSIPSVLSGQPLLTAHWWTFHLGVEAEMKLSTVLLFDLGVYLAVLGAILTIVVSLAEEEQ